MNSRTLAALAALTAASTLGGCIIVNGGSRTNSTWSRNVSFASFEAEDADLPSKRLVREFEVPEGKRLRLENIAGTVQLEMGDGPHVTVEAVVYARAAAGATKTQALLDGADWARAPHAEDEAWWIAPPGRTIHYPGLKSGETQATMNDGKYRIVSRPTTTAPTFFVDLKVTYPASTGLSIVNLMGPIEGGELAGNVLLDTAWGDVRTGEFDGTLVIDTASGDVTVGSVDGRLSADSSSGDIAVAWLEGRAMLDTSSGNIVVKGGDAERVGADSSSGDIVIRDASIDRVSLDTSSGDIRVENVDFRELAADSSSGEITVVGPLGDAEQMALDTSSGDIRMFVDDADGFRVTADQASGRLDVRFDDAERTWDGGDLIGARRGDERTRIVIDTSSGDATIAKRGG